MSIAELVAHGGDPMGGTSPLWAVLAGPVGASQLDTLCPHLRRATARQSKALAPRRGGRGRKPGGGPAPRPAAARSGKPRPPKSGGAQGGRQRRPARGEPGPPTRAARARTKAAAREGARRGPGGPSTGRRAPKAQRPAPPGAGRWAAVAQKGRPPQGGRPAPHTMEGLGTPARIAPGGPAGRGAGGRTAAAAHAGPPLAPPTNPGFGCSAAAWQRVAIVRGGRRHSGGGRSVRGRSRNAALLACVTTCLAMTDQVRGLSRPSGPPRPYGTDQGQRRGVLARHGPASVRQRGRGGIPPQAERGQAARRASAAARSGSRRAAWVRPSFT